MATTAGETGERWRVDTYGSESPSALFSGAELLLGAHHMTDCNVTHSTQMQTHDNVQTCADADANAHARIQSRIWHEKMMASGALPFCSHLVALSLSLLARLPLLLPRFSLSALWSKCTVQITWSGTREAAVSESKAARGDATRRQGPVREKRVREGGDERYAGRNHTMATNKGVEAAAPRREGRQGKENRVVGKGRRKGMRKNGSRSEAPERVAGDEWQTEEDVSTFPHLEKKSSRIDKATA